MVPVIDTEPVIVVLVGPTAVGKSSLAVALARHLCEQGRPTEIISGDSMLLYRGMYIGTAKPGVTERGGISHHLLDVLDVTETSTVAEFQRLARAAISDCQARGVLPVLVGGSALYVRAVVDQFEFPRTDPALRAELEADLAACGPEEMHRRLARADPAAAQVILPGNGRRIVRALEVVMLTGGPFRAQLPERRYALSGVRQLGLDIDRPSLDARIAARVDAMWAAGLVGEVRLLVERGLRQGRTASRALGYRQVLAHLAGELSEDEAKSATVRATRRFARRQDSWFRRDDRITWVPYDHPQLVCTVAGLLTQT